MRGTSRRCVAGVALMALLAAACDEVTVRERAATGGAIEGLGRSVQAVVLSEGLEAAWLARIADGLQIDAPASSPSEVTRPAIRLGPVLQRIPVSRFDVRPKQELTTAVMVLDTVQFIVPVRFSIKGSTVICRWQVSVSNVVSSVDLAVVEGSEGYNLEPITTPVTQLPALRVDAVGTCPVEFGEAPGGAPDELTRATFDRAIALYVEDSVSSAVDELLSTSSLELLGLIDGEVELSRPEALPNKRGVASIAGSLSRPEPAPLTVASGGLGVVLDYATSFEPAACAPLIELDAVSLDMANAEAISQADVRSVRADMGLALAGGLIERLLQTLTRAGFLCLGLDRIGTATQTLSLREVELGKLGISEALFGDRVQYSVTPGSLPRITLNTTLDTVDVSFEDIQLELYTELFGTSVLASRVTFSISVSLKLVPDGPGMVVLRLDAVKVDDVALESDWVTDSPQSSVLRDWTRRIVVLVFGESVRVPLPLRMGTQATLVEARVRRGDVVLFLSL